MTFTSVFIGLNAAHGIMLEILACTDKAVTCKQIKTHLVMFYYKLADKAPTVSYKVITYHVAIFCLCQSCYFTWHISCFNIHQASLTGVKCKYLKYPEGVHCNFESYWHFLPYCSDFYLILSFDLSSFLLI